MPPGCPFSFPERWCPLPPRSALCPECSWRRPRRTFLCPECSSSHSRRSLRALERSWRYRFERSSARNVCFPCCLDCARSRNGPVRFRIVHASYRNDDTRLRLGRSASRNVRIRYRQVRKTIGNVHDFRPYSRDIGLSVGAVYEGVNESNTVRIMKKDIPDRRSAIANCKSAKHP
jgi:hypothetical protein